MQTSAERLGPSGVPAGLTAGLVLLAAELIGAAWLGRPLLEPVSRCSRLVLGGAAASTPTWLTACVGGATLLVLTGIYGAVYGFLANALSSTLDVGGVLGAVMGAIFGLAVFFCDLETAEQASRSWSALRSSTLQAFVHAAFFGVPLGLIHGHRRHAAGGRRPQPRARRVARGSGAARWHPLHTS